MPNKFTIRVKPIDEYEQMGELDSAHYKWEAVVMGINTGDVNEETNEPRTTGYRGRSYFRWLAVRRVKRGVRKALRRSKHLERKPKEKVWVV